MRLLLSVGTVPPVVGATTAEAARAQQLTARVSTLAERSGCKLPSADAAACAIDAGAVKFAAATAPPQAPPQAQPQAQPSAPPPPPSLPPPSPIVSALSNAASAAPRAGLIVGVCVGGGLTAVLAILAVGYHSRLSAPPPLSLSQMAAAALRPAQGSALRGGSASAAAAAALRTSGRDFAGGGIPPSSASNIRRWDGDRWVVEEAQPLSEPEAAVMLLALRGGGRISLGGARRIPRLSNLETMPEAESEGEDAAEAGASGGAAVARRATEGAAAAAAGKDHHRGAARFGVQHDAAALH